MLKSFTVMVDIGSMNFLSPVNFYFTYFLGYDIRYKQTEFLYFLNVLSFLL